MIAKLTSKILGDLIKGSPFGFVDRILGMIWGCIKSVFLISIFMLIISLIMSLPLGNLNNWFIEDMKLNQEGFGIAKFLFNNNPIIFVINLVKSKL